MSELRKAVIKAKEQFEFYAKQHRAKLVPLEKGGNRFNNEAALAKAKTNRELAKKMQEALDAEGNDILALEKVQDYRFGSLVKGKHYAFARGLTINPAHLPAALDAMYQDGFETVCAFGDATSEKMGFLFKRIEPVESATDFAHGIGVYAEVERLRKRVDELLNANNNEVERRRESDRKLKAFEQGEPLDSIRSVVVDAHHKAVGYDQAYGEQTADVIENLAKDIGVDL